MNLDDLSIQEGLIGKTALVTGGAGFIGSHLVAALLETGMTVRCLDSLVTGSMQNVADTGEGNDAFQFIRGDTRDRIVCRESLEGVSLVFHQAALGSVPRSFDNPAETISANLVGLATLYSESVRAGVETFIYASSSSVYGDAQAPIKKEGEEGRPLSPYAVSKSAGDDLMAVLKMMEGPGIIGLRYFNVFGSRQNPKGAYAAMIPKFTLSMLRGERPVIFGDGEQTRDFTYIENVVEANMKAAIAPVEAYGKVFNVGCGGAISVLQIYDLIREAVEQTTSVKVTEPPVMAEARPGEPRRSTADISLARELLQYDPQFEIQEGLLQTVRWFNDHQDWYPAD
ncbi:NAD-dependent epimerase/dehydratase family protein [Candidatus Zixiibacteriota bacterium]